MSLANQQGGHIVSMRITRNSSNESATTLKKPFLKDASKWSCQLTDCFVNRSSPILSELLDGETAHFTITPFIPVPATFVPATNEFRPYKCRSVLEYFNQLHNFCTQWSYTYSRSKQIVEALPGFAVGVYNVNFQTAINYLEHDLQGGVDVGHSTFAAKHLQVSLTAGLKLALIGTIEFCTHFHVAIHPRVQTLIGLPPNLFSVTRLGNPYTSNDNIILPALPHTAPLNPGTFTSGLAIKQLDERFSLDIWVSFPISNRIEVLNGNEIHEHLLGRFDLTDVKEFMGTTFRKSGTRKLTEKFQSGMENLTRNNPDYEANHLLPGQLQNVNVRIRTRYFNRQTKLFNSSDSDFEDALWHLRLLFSKKT